MLRISRAEYDRVRKTNPKGVHRTKRSYWKIETKIVGGKY